MLPAFRCTSAPLWLMQLSDQEKKELRDIFDLVDRDKGGTISSEELLHLMRTLGLAGAGVSAHESVAPLLKEVDTDRNAVIDFKYVLDF